MCLGGAAIIIQRSKLGVAVEVARPAVNDRSRGIADKRVVSGKCSAQVGACGSGGVERNDAVTDLHLVTAVVHNATTAAAGRVIGEGAVRDIKGPGAVVENAAAAAKGAAGGVATVRGVTTQSAVREIDCPRAAVVNAAAAAEAGRVSIKRAFGNVDRPGVAVENTAAKVSEVTTYITTDDIHCPGAAVADPPATAIGEFSLREAVGDGQPGDSHNARTYPRCPSHVENAKARRFTARGPKDRENVRAWSADR